MTNHPRQQAYLSLLPLLLTSILIMGPYLAGPLGLHWPDTLRQSVYPLNSALIQLSLFFLQLFINGKIITSGFRAIYHRHPNVDSLILLGVIGSLGLALTSIDTVGRGADFPLTLELYIFHGISLLAISAFSNCIDSDNQVMPESSDTLLHMAIWYVPTTAVLALLAFAWAAFADDLNAAYIFIIFLAACPAAIKLVYPLLMLKLSHLCQSNGIILQRPEALSLLPQMNVLVCALDGILTKGEPEVKETVSQGILVDKMLTMAATAETYMDNDIAWAIVREARQRKLILGSASGTNVIAGMGIEAIQNRMLVRVGSANLLRSQKIEINAEMLTKADQFAAKGMFSLFVNSGYYCRGIIGVQDNVSAEASSMVPTLRDMEVDTVLLTGKDSTTARYFGRQLELEQVIGSLTPEEKAKEIQVRKAQGQIVAAIGKSNSFTEALEAADISIVPQSAHPDIRKNAHIVLENNDVSAIARAVSLGLSWERKLKHCIAVSFIMNLFMLSLSAVIVYNTAAATFHPLIPLISTIFTILGLIICVNTLKVE